MKQYMVIKKCYANEFMTVDADSQEQAIEKAYMNEGKSVMNHLEFNGYQPKEGWEAEELKPNGLKYTKSNEI
tara:strand:- start:500 stop:715 length:216 start_codon:yes stop_codon:yes gene_type:complete